MRILGQGTDALRKFASDCQNAGGIPVAQAWYAGVEFKDKLLVRCYGANMMGGFVTEISSDLVNKVAQSRKRYTALSDILKTA